MRIQDENIKLSIGDKLLLAFGLLFIVFELVFATGYNLYLLMSGNSNNAITHCVNALGGILVTILFYQAKDKVGLSKCYFLLTLFLVMYFAVMWVSKRAEYFTALLIMATGTGLIAYLSHKFFNRDDNNLWQRVQEKTDYTKMSDERLIREYNAVDKQRKMLIDLQMNAAENDTFGALNLHITEIIFTLIDRHKALKREISSRGLNCS